MINNCLVTKLNGVVDNDNLLPLGYEKFKFRVNDPYMGATVIFKENAKMILLDGTWKDNGTRELTILGASQFYPGFNTVTPDVQGSVYCTILIPKYICYGYGNLYPLEGTDVYMSGFKYINANDIHHNYVYVNLYENETKWTIHDLKSQFLPKLRVFWVSGAKFAEPLDITGIGSGGGIITFDMGNCGIFNDVYGSLDSLGFSNITNFGYLPNTKNVSIDLVNYVNNHRSSGRTSGSVNLLFVGSITVKVNGTVKEIENKRDNILAWTADSITLDGNPI